jgi:hypothetical protein
MLLLQRLVIRPLLLVLLGLLVVVVVLTFQLCAGSRWLRRGGLLAPLRWQAALLVLAAQPRFEGRDHRLLTAASTCGVDGVKLCRQLLLIFIPFKLALLAFPGLPTCIVLLLLLPWLYLLIFLHCPRLLLAGPHKPLDSWLLPLSIPCPPPLAAPCITDTAAARPLGRQSAAAATSC